MTSVADATRGWAEQGTVRDTTRILVIACACVRREDVADLLSLEYPMGFYTVIGEVGRIHSVECDLIKPGHANTLADQAVVAKASKVIIVTGEHCRQFSKYFAGSPRHVTRAFLERQRPVHLRCAMNIIQERAREKGHELDFQVFIVRRDRMQHITPRRDPSGVDARPSPLAHMPDRRRDAAQGDREKARRHRPVKPRGDRMRRGRPRA